MSFSCRRYLFDGNDRFDVEKYIGEMPSDAWEEWGREHGRLLSADELESSTVLMIFLVNPQDLMLFHVIDFHHAQFGRCSRKRSAACALLGSKIYVVGGLDSVDTEKRREDVYVCDLADPPLQWTPGPPLIAGMFYPLLVCLAGKIYALDVHASGSDGDGSFQMLHQESGWRMLRPPPFLPLQKRYGCVEGCACVGDDKIVIHVREITSLTSYLCREVLACFYEYDVKLDKWSELAKIKRECLKLIVGHSDEKCFSDVKFFNVPACQSAPYRAYVKDLSLIIRPDGFLSAFDFTSLRRGDAEGPSPSCQVLRSNFVCSSVSESHIYHLGGTKFCALLTCSPYSCYPVVHICTFDLLGPRLDYEKLFFSGVDLSSDEWEDDPGEEDEDDCGDEDEDEDDCGDEDEDEDDCGEDENLPFKIVNFKRKSYIDRLNWFVYEACRRPEHASLLDYNYWL